MTWTFLTDTMVELHVPDFETAKTFYAKLGFEVVREKPPHEKEGYLVLRKRKSILCFYCGNEKVYEHSFFNRFPKTTPRGYGVEIFFPEENIESFYETVIQSLGEECVVQPLQLQRWGIKDFRIVDPFGFYLRFSEPYDITIGP